MFAEQRLHDVQDLSKLSQKRIRKYKKKTKTLKNKLSETTRTLNEKNKDVQKKQTDIKELQLHIDNNKAALITYQTDIDALQSTIHSLQQHRDDLQAQCKIAEAGEAKAVAELAVTGKNYVAKRDKLKKVEDELRSKNAILKEKRSQIRGLQREKWKLQDSLSIANDWLTAIQESTSWKVTRPLRSISKTMQRAVGKYHAPAPDIPASSSTVQMVDEESQPLPNLTAVKKYKGEGKDAAIIDASGLFDRVYYLTENPSVQNTHGDAINHYCEVGWQKHLQPNASFNTAAYLAANLELKKSGKNPFVHFIQNNPDIVKAAKLSSRQKTKSGEFGRVVVFMAVAGPYDDLKEPLIVSDSADYVIFTDQPVPDDSIWQKRGFDYFNADTPRMARFIKLHPHVYFPNYDWAIWVDANLQLNAMPEDIIRNHVGQHDIATWHHPLRDCVYDEAEECMKRSKDNDELISEQIKRYKAAAHPAHDRLFETSVFISRPKEQKVRDFFNVWWREMEMGSRRDQLGLPIAANEIPNLNIGYLAPQNICMRSDPRFIYFRHKP